MEWGISFFDLHEDAQDAFINAICKETGLDFYEVNAKLCQDAHKDILLGSINWVMPYN